MSSENVGQIANKSVVHLYVTLTKIAGELAVLQEYNVPHLSNATDYKLWKPIDNIIDHCCDMLKRMQSPDTGRG